MLLLVLAATLALTRGASAQNNQMETINFDQALSVDDIGNAVITIKMKLTASQFMNWQGKYGQNKSLLKRDVNKFLSMYDTYDWDVSEKQMEREITITLKAKGTVIHKGRGTYEFRVPKEWRGGERNGNVFNFNYVEDLGGSIGQFNVKLTAPTNATNFREQLSEAGDKVIQYTIPVAGKQTWMLTAGIVLAVLGAGLAGSTLLSRVQPLPVASASSARRAKPVLAHSKPIDPPSMSTIPLEMSTSSTEIPEPKRIESKKRT